MRSSSFSSPSGLTAFFFLVSLRLDRRVHVSTCKTVVIAQRTGPTGQAGGKRVGEERDEWRRCCTLYSCSFPVPPPSFSLSSSPSGLTGGSTSQYVKQAVTAQRAGPTGQTGGKRKGRGRSNRRETKGEALRPEAPPYNRETVNHRSSQFGLSFSISVTFHSHSQCFSRFSRCQAPAAVACSSNQTS